MYGNGYQYGKIFGGGGLPFTPPLDVYTGAAAAYSLRLLRSAYAGSAIRVRRSSDNSESDIGFVSGVLDTATLLTFCGVGDGFVTTWYDQSGNGNDAAQPTAANQPKIVDAGVLVTDNGKPALNFDGVNDRLSAGDVLDMGTNDLSIFATAKQVVNNDGYLVSKSSTSVNEGYSIFHQNLSTFRATIRNGGSNINTSLTLSDAVNSQGLSTAIFDRSADMDVYFNGAFSNGVDISGISASDISNNIDFYIGYVFAFVARYYGGLIQEIIIYSSDQSSNRTGIETNINSYYGIY